MVDGFIDVVGDGSIVVRRFSPQRSTSSCMRHASEGVERAKWLIRIKSTLDD